MAGRWSLFIAVGLSSLLCDQATKLWAREALPLTRAGCSMPTDFLAGACHGESVSVIDGLLEWRLGFNPGSAFGMLGGQAGARIILSVIGIAAVLLMLWMVHKAKGRPRRLVAAFAMVAGGALGNVIDRIRMGAVTDFIVLRYEHHEWPTFNVADILLVVGAALMLSVRDSSAPRKERPS